MAELLSGEEILAAVDRVCLVDNPVDGYGEEYAWVPCGAAATPEAAIELLSAEVPLEGDELVYLCQGQSSWHRPLAFAQRQGWFFVLNDQGAEEHLGHSGTWTEYCPWEHSNSEDPKAIEFWDVEVGDKEALAAVG